MRNVKRSMHWSHLVVRGLFTMALAALLLAGLQSVVGLHLGNTAPTPGTPATAAQSIAVATAPAPGKPCLPPQPFLLPQGSKPVLPTNCVGDEACRACHQGQVDTYHHTAHFLTSSLPGGHWFDTRFSPGSNLLMTVETNLSFRMHITENGYFETAIKQLSPTQIAHHTEQIDIVIGSGRKAQTYLFWKGDQLFELPVSYWINLGKWGYSPGYIDGSARFERPVFPRCLECHANSFEALAPFTNRYHRASLVLGMSCEKCHGPGREHVARFLSQSPPQSPSDMAIINPARLSRDRQMDACGLCHAGAGVPLVPSLSFQPGDVLSNYVTLPGTNTPLDVHGMQSQMLAISRCFQSSPAMTCSTCHDVHKPQRDLAAFAANCLACHLITNCGEFVRRGHQIDDQCVVCHMPLQKTEVIISRVNGTTSHPKVRNHQIAIYPDVQLP
jgi:Cytochrome c554 and c-prime